MPPQLLFDIPDVDQLPDLFNQEVIREYNPQRDDMEMLNGIVYVDPQKHRLLGYKDVRTDEFWVTGHIPGRPLFPGVLMIECGAQLASFYTRKFTGWTGFVGFGGVDECRFRQQIVPPRAHVPLRRTTLGTPQPNVLRHSGSGQRNHRLRD